MRARLLIAALALALVGFGFRNDPAAIERAIASGDFGRRAGAIESIVRRGSIELGALIVPLIIDEDERIRGMAIEAAASLRLESAVPALFEILRLENEAQRIEAVKALAAINNEASRDALARALLDPVTEVRVAVLMNARVGGDLVSPAASALDDPDPSVRSLAARALGESGGPGALLSLMGKLGDPSPDVRASVARALGALGLKEAAPILGGALEDPEIPVREAAALALARVGSRAAESANGEAINETVEEIARLLLSFIDRDNSQARGSAILALAELGDAAPTERLMRLIHREELREPMERAVETLSDRSAQRPRLARALLGELERASVPSVTLRIAQGLERVLSAGPVEGLTPRLIDALEFAPQRRGELLRALGASGDKDALITLLVELDRVRLEASRSSDRSASAGDLLAALRSLQARGGVDHRVIQPALDALPYLSSDDRADLISVIAPLRPPELLEALLQSLERRSHPSVRRVSAAALAYYQDEEAAERLLALLDDRDPEVRASAARGLGESAPLDWLPRLIERFGRPEPTDRRQALAIVGALLERGALEEAPISERATIAESLHQIVHGRSRSLASEALDALSRSSGARATELLFASLARSDPALSAQSLRALRVRESEQTRAVLVEVIQGERPPHVQAAALFAIGRVGRERDLELVERALERGPLRAREAASFALLELRERGLVSADRAAGYCGALRAPSLIIQVNLMLLTERLGAPCAAFGSPEEVLERSDNEFMRIAAAALLAERGGERAEAALARCQRREPLPSILHRCEQGALSDERVDVRVRAVLPGEASPLSDRALIVQFADGRLLPAMSDPRAELFLPAIPAGMIRIFDPASLRLLP